MAKNLRYFNTNTEYQAADLVFPSVSYVEDINKVIYDPSSPTPPTFQGKWLATYSDSHTETAQCDSSSAITEGEINITNLVSVEIGDCATSIGRYAFSDCSSLTSITIPNSVTTIGDAAFSDCSSLTSIDIPNSVTRIDGGAFVYCTSLTSIDMPSGVTSIGDYTFAICSSLTSITISDSVTTIGNSAFQDCSSLTSITVNATTPPSLRNNAFNNTNNCPIYVPSQSVEAYKTASGWSVYESRIQAIPNS